MRSELTGCWGGGSAARRGSARCGAGRSSPSAAVGNSRRGRPFREDNNCVFVQSFRFVSDSRVFFRVCRPPPAGYQTSLPRQEVISRADFYCAAAYESEFFLQWHIHDTPRRTGQMFRKIKQFLRNPPCSNKCRSTRLVKRWNRDGSLCPFSAGVSVSAET